MESEVGKVRSLKNYIAYIKFKGNFTSNHRDLRFNTITIDYWEDFIRNLDRLRMLIFTGNITCNPPPELAASSRSCSHQLTPVESFKRSIKWYSSQFTNFKEGKYWDTWRRNTLATARAQDLDKVLDPDYAPLNQEEMKLFSEKQTFMHYVFPLPCKPIEVRSLLESMIKTLMLDRL